MPIRIKKDPKHSSGSKGNYPGRNTNTGGGGGNPIVYFLPAIMKMFGKNPKLLIIVAIIAGLIYFFGGGGNCGGAVTDIASSAFSTGAPFNEAKYAETEVFEPLADNKKNPLPERISLLKYAPKRLNQGRQGSCVGWASAYAARTILYSKQTGNDPNKSAFSPAYLYNQIALDGCQGTYLPEAMKTMKAGGVAPFSVFSYDESTCSDKPDREEAEIAKNYRIEGFERLTNTVKTDEVNMLAIKQNLAQGAPVVIGMMVGGSFMQSMSGEEVWIPTSSDYDMRGFGGHAMCVIGYDDYLEGGSFQLMNSWGENWGDKGTAWVRYQDFDYFTKEAYGLHPMGDIDAPRGTVNKVELGLWLSDTGSNLALKSNSDGTFSSASNLNAETAFKIEVSNTLPCYIYVFGAELDGSSYVLFPYTDKHSPYCGITGTRLFPKDYVLYPDDQGSQDEIAVVLSAKPLDYDEFNARLSAASGDYNSKLQSALGRAVNPRAVRGGETASVELELGDTGVWGSVIRISK